MSEKVCGLSKKEFDYRIGTIAVICPNCDCEISETDINEFREKEIFSKKRVPIVSIKKCVKPF